MNLKKGVVAGTVKYHEDLRKCDVDRDNVFVEI